MAWEIEVENHLGFDLLGKNKGIFKTTCVFCSDERKKKSDKCCTVNLDDGWYYCHHCGEHGRLHKYKHVAGEKEEYNLPSYNSSISFTEEINKWFKEERAISYDTLDKMHIQAGVTYFPQISKERSAIVFPYFFNGVCINKKFRDAKKNFAMVSGAQKMFYNIDSILGSDTCIITEGEIDVLSFVEAGVYNAISVPNGATKGRNNIEYLADVYNTHFKDKKEIIIATDNDDNGICLRDELARRLGKGRCFVVDFKDCKDSNEYLVKYGKDKLLKVLANKEPYPVDGIFELKGSVLDELLYEQEHGTRKGSTTHIQSLDAHFTWLKPDQIVIAGYNNMGKTEFLYQLCMLKAIHSGWKFAVAAFEDKTPGRFYRKLVEMFVGMRLDPSQQQYDNHMTKKQLMQASEFVREHFKYVRPPQDFTRQNMLDLFSYSVSMFGVDSVIIDPYNKLVKNRDSTLRDDEYLIEYYNMLGVFSAEHDVVPITITHMNRPPSMHNGVPEKPTRFNLLGGQATGNAVDEIIFVHKDSSDKSDPTRLIIVDKVRDIDLVGIPGEISLRFDYRKRRYMDGDYDPFLGYETTAVERHGTFIPTCSSDRKEHFVDDFIPY